MCDDCKERTPNRNEERADLMQQYSDKKMLLKQLKEERRQERKEICQKLGHVWERRATMPQPTGRHTFWGELYRVDMMELCVICGEFHCRINTIIPITMIIENCVKIPEEHQKMLAENQTKNVPREKKIKELEEEVEQLEKQLKQ